jgi:hypothetical protein
MVGDERTNSEERIYGTVDRVFNLELEQPFHSVVVDGVECGTVGTSLCDLSNKDDGAIDLVWGDSYWTNTLPHLRAGGVPNIRYVCAGPDEQREQVSTRQELQNAS